MSPELHGFSAPREVGIRRSSLLYLQQGGAGGREGDDGAESGFLVGQDGIVYVCAIHVTRLPRIP